MVSGGSARLLVVLALLAGLLGMHALVSVAPHAEHPGGPDHAVAAGPAAGTDGYAPAVHDPARSHTHDQHAAPAPGGPHHLAGHSMLHLCLAVLTALLLVLTALAPVVAGCAAHGPERVGHRRPRLPPLRPPSTSVRLARLCVLRN